MIFEIEDETRDFVTIYKKDFPSKKIEKRREYRPKPEYPAPLNILNGPYRKFLNTKRKNLTLPPEEQGEDPEEALSRIRDQHPRLKKCFPVAAMDEKLIDRKENEVTQTVYQLDLCKGDYEPRVQIYGRRKDILLPKDWVISETIQKRSYRNPWKIATADLLKVKKVQKPPDNLNPSRKEREILRIRTGDSEYNATIDTMGDKIIKKCFLGAPLPLEPKIFVKGPDDPISECSRILAKKKLALPSNIF